MANQTQRGGAAHESWRMLRFSLYAGFFVAGVGFLFALYGIYASLWAWPNSWGWILYLIGGFAVGFLGTLCYLLETSYYVGSRKKDVI